MNRKPLVIIIFLSFLGLVGEVSAQTDTEFWVVVPEINDTHVSGWADEPHKGAPGIFRFTTFDLPSTVTLSLPADPTFTPLVFDIPANSTYSYEFWNPSILTDPLYDHDEYCGDILGGPSCLDPNNWCTDLPEIENFIELYNKSSKGVLIEATNTITCYFEIAAQANREIIALKGKNALGKEFRVPFQTAYPNRTGGAYTTTLIYSAIHIVATVDGTDVTVYNDKSLYIRGYGTDGEWPVGTPYTVTLDKGEVFSAVPFEDMAPDLPLNISKDKNLRLTGTRVTATQPVAVHTTDDLLDCGGGVDFVADQCVPNTILGSDYIVMRGQDPSDSPDVGEETAYILAIKDNTPIYVDGVYENTINAGQQYQREVSNKATRISTNDPAKPITILHVSGVPNQVGGAILPPIDDDKCTGSFDVVVNRSDDMTFNMMVMVRKDGKAGFTVNGNTTIIEASDFTDVPGTDWATAFIPWNAPINTPLNIKNSINMFHIGTLLGQAGQDCFYGYFSDFNSNRGEAVSSSTNGTLDADHCLGETIQLRSEGGKSYLWTCATDNSFNDPTLSSPTINPVSGLHKYDVNIDRTCYLDTTMTIYVKIDSVNSYFEIEHPGPDCCSPVVSDFNNKSFGDLDFYYWDFSDGDVSLDSLPPQKLSVNTGSEVDTLIIGLTVGKNCYDYYEDTIFVRPEIIAAAKGTKLSGCNEYIPVEFDIIGASGPFVRFEFDWGDGNTSNFTRPADINAWRYTYTYTNLTDSDVTYTAVATFYDDLNICIDSSEFTITFVPGIARANFVVSDSVGCSPHTVNFVNTKSGTVPYVWDFKNGTLSTTATDTTITFTNTSPNPIHFDVFMEVTRGACTHDTTKRITVYPEFETTIAANQIAGCNGLDVEFTQTTVPAIDSIEYDWNFGDGSGWGKDGPYRNTYSHTEKTIQNYPVSLITTSEFHCKDTSNSLNIEVFEFVDANFSVSDAVGCSPLEVVVENISSNNSVDNFVWTISDTLPGSDAPINSGPFTLYYQNQTGSTVTRTITLGNNVDAPNNCPESISRNITIYPEVTARFTKSNGVDTICHNTIVSFVNNSVFSGVLSTIDSINTNTFLWEFDDGSTSGRKNPTKLYKNSTGVLKESAVKLTVNVNGCTSVFFDTVRVYSEIKAQLNTDEVNICTPIAGGITLNNTSLGGSVFTWTFSDGSAPQVLNNKGSITYLVDNTEPNSVINPKVYLTASASSCSHTDSITLNVYPHIVPHIEPDVVAGCGPLSVNLANQTTGGSTSNPLIYSWAFGNNENSNLASPATRVYANRTTSDKTYTIRLTAKNELGCSNSHDTTVIVYPEVVPMFTYSKPNECTPVNVSFENNSVNGVNTLYRWDFGFDSNTADTTVRNFNYLYNHSNAHADSLVNYNIKLVVYDQNHPQCSDSVSQPISIYPPVIASFDVSDNERGCSPLISEFTNNSTGYDLTYVWNYRDNNTSANIANIHYHEFENLTSDSIVYDVRLIVDDINGCRQVTQQPVTAYPKVIADFTFKKDSLSNGCTPFDVNFTYPLTALNGNKFDWDFGYDYNEESYSNKNPFTFNFDNEFEDIQTYTIRLISSDTETGCRDTATRTIEVYPHLIPEFSFAGDNEGCNPLTVEFENESTGLGNYLWDFNDEQTSSLVSPEHVFGHYENNDKVFNVTLTATQAKTGCEKSVSDVVTVYSYMNAKFGITQAGGEGAFGGSSAAGQLLGGCHPFNVTLTDSSTCNGTWFWNFGNDDVETDNARPSARDLTYYNYDDDEDMENEQYTIFLELENSQGCIKQSSQTIEVYPRSVPLISGDFQGCHPHTVNFANNTINDNNGRYYWRLGDGATSVLDTLSYTYYNSGFFDNETFEVTLISTTGNLCVDSVKQNVTVNPKPLAAIRPIHDRGCSPLDALVENTSEMSSPYNFIWDFDQGNPTVETDELTTEGLQYVNDTDDAIIKYIKLIAETEYGCTDTVTQLINVYPQANADFIPSVTSGCSPLGVHFYNTSNETTTLFNWEFGNGATSQLKEPDVNFFNDGTDDTTFTVSLVSQSPYGCDSEMTKEITVYLAPNAEFLALDPVKTYPDTVMEFKNLVKPGPWDFDWDYGDDHESNDRSLIHDHVYDGWGPRAEDFSYTVRLKVYSDHCESESWQVVTINPPKPYIEITERNQLGCEPLEIDFFVKYGFGYEDSITWNFGNGDYSTEVNPNYTYEEAGLYVSSVTIRGDGGLFIDTTKINVYPKPEPDFEFRPDFVMLPDQAVQMFNTTYLVNNSTYRWDFGDGVTSTEIQPAHYYTKENIYNIKLVATTQHGCMDSITKYAAVTVSGEGHINFPNAFMPDSKSGMDGGYSMFDDNVFHPNHEGVKDYELWIFNRWGEQLFYSDKVEIGWNGRYGNTGDELGQDVYFWKAKGEFNNGVPFKKAGDVTLIRK